MQGIRPGITIHRDNLVIKQEKTQDFATLFLGFYEDEEYFALLHDIYEAKQNTFLQGNPEFLRAVTSFFENGGQRLYLLNFPFTQGFDTDSVYTFLANYCDTLSDLETICAIGLVEGRLSDDEVSEDEVLRTCFQINDYAAETDRISITDIDETIKDLYLDRLGETVIYYPWFIDRENKLLAPSVIASALASKLAFEGKFFHSIANKEIGSLKRLSQELSKSEVAELNENGINPIVNLHMKGVRVWGVHAFNSKYETVNEMRVLKYIKRSFKRLGRAYVFEGNTEHLRDRFHAKIYHFLHQLWEMGALAGTTQAEAFEIDMNTKPLNAERNSLVIDVSVAISRPLEFIVIRLNRVEHNGAQESLSVEA